MTLRSSIRNAAKQQPKGEPVGVSPRTNHEPNYPGADAHRLAKISPPSIEVHIEELVLHGLPLTSRQGPAVQAAIEAELARLLTEQGIRSSAGAMPSLAAGSIRLTKDMLPVQMGCQIAQAIYDGLTPTSPSPRDARSVEGAS